MNHRYLECWRLKKVFKTATGNFLAVRDFSLHVAEGEFISLIGHSGCGKSTVLSMVAGLHALDGGGLVLDNKEIDAPGPDRAVVFQSPNLLPWLSALENVSLAVEQASPQLTYSQRESTAAQWLRQVGLGAALRKRPGELSQGMQQRVGIARAFAMRPKLLLLDEPFGMLDSLTRLELQDVLLEIWKQDRITTLMVTHDVDEAIKLSDRIVMMTNGPAATIGDVLTVDLPRPRDPLCTETSPAFDILRQRVLDFLSAQDHPQPPLAPDQPTLAVEPLTPQTTNH
jgi:nitrate ABC transporter ATP-binding subunit